jgi:DNA-binding NarL/FixJ family response regulator
MGKIKVLLAEDHTIVRQGLRSLLEQSDDIKVVAEAEDGREAVKKTELANPDVVLMDVSMPLLNGIEATRQIKKQCPDVKVLILTMHTTEEYILQILHAGASGYLVKKSAHQELLSAVRAVHKGHSYLSPSVSKKVVNDYIEKTKKAAKTSRYEKLTGREREVLQLIAEGKSNKEISELLYLSVKTVETHKAHLMAKLDIHTTAGLVKYAIQKRIISKE